MHRRLRLRHPRDFARLRREGEAYHHRLLILSVAPNELPHNRYGFIVSKALGNAVKRNRVRRQLREVIRHTHPKLKHGFDVVIVGKKALVGQPFIHISRTVNQLTKQADLFAEGHHEQT